MIMGCLTVSKTNIGVVYVRFQTAGSTEQGVPAQSLWRDEPTLLHLKPFWTVEQQRVRGWIVVILANKEHFQLSNRLAAKLQR